MVFSSNLFLFVFLPLFLLCYWTLPWRNLVALLFSLLFFAWGEGAYLILLLLVISMNYGIGCLLGPGRVRRFALTLGVGLNLLVLGYYKYFGFLLSDVLRLNPPAEAIPHLPIGLSFFIFQSISYLVDVYRKTSPPARSWFDLALYISMFPQLVAGPIVRYNSVSAAIRRREVTAMDVYWGGTLFITGLGYKVLLADNAAQVADAIFGMNLAQLNSVTAWTGATAYTLQIYFDFAGYSLMAIGLGRMMGFCFPRNFNYPYVAQSVTDFWRRWHMSLSSWFRDYLYIPLGGNRVGKARTYANLFVVFLLCGLWHGAAWTFIAWGMYHGLLLILERGPGGHLLTRLWAPLRHGYTLLMVLIGWVLFRSDTIDQAVAFLRLMLLPQSGTGPSGLLTPISHENIFFLVLAGLLSLPITVRIFTAGQSLLAQQGGPLGGHKQALGALASLLLLLVCGTYVMSGSYSPFIYFRF